MKRVLLYCLIFAIFFTAVGVQAADTWYETPWPPCDAIIYLKRSDLLFVHPAGIFGFVIKKGAYHKANEGNDYFSEHHVYWTDLKRWNDAQEAEEKAKREEKARKAGL